MEDGVLGEGEGGIGRVMMGKEGEEKNRGKYRIIVI